LDINLYSIFQRGFTAAMKQSDWAPQSSHGHECEFFIHLDRSSIILPTWSLMYK